MLFLRAATLVHSSLSKLAHSWREWFETRHEQQRAYRELMALDDSSLSDIGIARGNIPYVVSGRKHAQREREVRERKRIAVGMQLSGRAAPCIGTEK